MVNSFWDWDDEPEGNVQRIAEHGIFKDDVEAVLADPVDRQNSRSSKRPIWFGYTPDGRYIGVVFQWIDSDTVYPVTAFEVLGGD